MEEQVLVDEVMPGRWVSLVLDPNGREWKVDISSGSGYPPTYTAKVDKKKVPGGPFDAREHAHNVALIYIERQFQGDSR